MSVTYWILQSGKYKQVSRDEFDAWNGKRCVTASGQTPAWNYVTGTLAAFAGRYV